MIVRNKLFLPFPRVSGEEKMYVGGKEETDQDPGRNNGTKRNSSIYSTNVVFLVVIIKVRLIFVSSIQERGNSHPPTTSITSK